MRSERARLSELEGTATYTCAPDYSLHTGIYIVRTISCSCRDDYCYTAAAVIRDENARSLSVNQAKEINTFLTYIFSLMYYISDR